MFLLFKMVLQQMKQCSSDKNKGFIIKKVERRNVGHWVLKVWYDDEKVKKETIEKCLLST